ncbi:hypothetical protein G4X40_06980 [Rhodococcus sp. D2-41]|uniref:Uncharacterized protein n=1 Tax=Speluncibacter jeojiensis TaxID=2710754 RepID=A0A9X4M0M7_9ACTN|nr:hypothetical protein [Rhodococcus sp. D2-41]MDG3009889.1 hypothetical protein [Rhodococcus sp. D2-41]MDG3014639.1 hypothetical protein [Corynebacteriales bacterium D3-21]
MSKVVSIKANHRWLRSRNVALVTGLSGVVGAGVFARTHRDGLDALANHPDIHCDPQT